MLEPGVPKKLVRHYADERIGCINGLMKPDGSPSIYWKYENWVKRQESRIGSFSGASRAAYSIRRKLFSPLSPNTINCDFYIVTAVIAAGSDVIFDEEAIAHEHHIESSSKQFEHHVVDGTGNFQAMGIFKKLLIPFKGSFVYVSHRVFKWIVPFCLILVFLSSMLLVTQSPFMAVIFICQSVMYLLSLTYYFTFARSGRTTCGVIGKLMYILYYFMIINVSLLVGAICYMTGKIRNGSSE